MGLVQATARLRSLGVQTKRTLSRTALTYIPCKLKKQHSRTGLLLFLGVQLLVVILNFSIDIFYCPFLYLRGPNLPPTYF